MINVLIVDDSASMRELMTYIISSDPKLRVMGTASNGEKALAFLKSNKPDIITMDINMPVMDGLETIKRIMGNNPIPIIIVSSGWNSEDMKKTFQAMEVGAVAVADKPWGPEHPDYEITAAKLTEKIKVMSGVKVIRRWNDYKDRNEIKALTDNDYQHERLGSPTNKIRLVVMGSSTGGPPVLESIFSQLPVDFPVPIVVVQHITQGFLENFVEWMNQVVPINVKIASDGEYLKPGHVYFAPDNHQLRVTTGGIVRLSDNYEKRPICPSVSYLFKHTAGEFGSAAVGIILTGMGRDGAEELLLMRQNGAITIAQDKESSVIHGMPGEAIKLGAADHILSPGEIITFLRNLVTGN